MIPLPNKIYFVKDEKFESQIVIEPLYPGYGMTIGNALRRVLLSSLPGAAVTGVKIKGVDHEFSTVPNVVEDVVDIVLNIKRIVLEVEEGVEITKDSPLVIKINKKGEGKVTAGDIECPSQVKVANKDLLIATLTDQAASFEAEFTIERGLGYVPVGNYKGEKLSIGHMVVDAIFTPIKEVAIKVERVRVGEMTNWDKLILDIETNGACQPDKAFDIAVDVLHSQIDFLKNWRQAGVEDDSPEVIAEEVPDENKEEAVKSEEKDETSTDSDPAVETKKKRGRPAKKDKEEE